jgi:hypothetical protein
MRQTSAKGVLLLVVLLLLSVSGAAAANPWQLRCASMPAEQTLPAPLRGRVAVLSVGAGGEGPAVRPGLSGRALEQDRDLA